MKIEKFENREQWMEARLGKITGTRLSDVISKRKGTGKKIGFYELIAERLSVTEQDFEGYVPSETPLQRGQRLQKYAVDRFSKETGKKVDETLVLWMKEDNESIAISPDGTISETEAIETKCLSSARHVEAYLTKAVPDEYEYQVMQYFIVNDKLETLYFVFYDTRLPAIQYFVIEVHRDADMQAKVEEYLKYQQEVIKEVDDIVASLTF